MLVGEEKMLDFVLEHWEAVFALNVANFTWKRIKMCSGKVCISIIFSVWLRDKRSRRRAKKMILIGV